VEETVAAHTTMTVGNKAIIRSISVHMRPLPPLSYHHYRLQPKILKTIDASATDGNKRPSTTMTAANHVMVHLVTRRSENSVTNYCHTEHTPQSNSRETSQSPMYRFMVY
jgi:hypothetical protein